MKRFPFLSFPASLLILRITTAIMFMAHAAVRILNGTIPRFATYMDNQGFPYPTAVVWAITVVELVSGTLLILDKGTKWAAASLMAIAAGGIVLVHAAQGWFVGEHGAGGVEYSVVLIAACVVLAAADGMREGRAVAA